MEDLIRQRFNYAEITLLKDYCTLNQKKSKIYFDLDEYDDGDNKRINLLKEKVSSPFDSPFDGAVKRTLKSTSIPLPEKYKGGKKTKFYYGNEYIGERIFMDYARKSNEPFIVTSSRQIKKHYANPYTTIRLTTHERSIRKNGDKITIKLYSGCRVRLFNNRYFKKSTAIKLITINMKTGNFTTMSMVGKLKSFRTNSFQKFNLLIKEILSQRYYVKSELKYGFLDEEADQFIYELYKIFGDKSYEYGFGKWEPSYYLNNIFMVNFTSWFAKTKQIKTPNKFHNLIFLHYPTEKFLKKNDRKLIASVLDFHNIKSKYTIKLLHEVPNINLIALKLICFLLGNNYSKYLYNINHNTFVMKNEGDITSYRNYRPINQVIVFSEKEKENICNIINSRDKLFTYDDLGYFEDHRNMMEKLRPYYPDIEIKAKTWEDFQSEHLELSRMISLIRKTYEVQYIFSPKMLEEVEVPITIEIKVPQEVTPDDMEIKPDMVVSGTFYPYVLKTESDYKEEGSFMHHCVASYSDKNKSVIISIRTDDKSDRITCEIDTQTGICLQARHFCNRTPPEDMMMVLNELRPKLERLARFGLLNSIEKKKIPIKINGIEVTSVKGEVNLNENLFVPF